MARPTLQLVEALRSTAERLDDETVTYRWSSFAHCNCGHLAQTVTGLEAEEIQERGMRSEGDWGRQARERSLPISPFECAPDEGVWEPEEVRRCAATGVRLDTVIDALFQLGLDARDVEHLERLSDPLVRRRLGSHTVEFDHNRRSNVTLYLRAWAELLEEKRTTLDPSAAANPSAAVDSSAAAHPNDGTALPVAAE